MGKSTWAHQPNFGSIDSDQQEAHTLANHCNFFRSNGFGQFISWNFFAKVARNNRNFAYIISCFCQCCGCCCCCCFGFGFDFGYCFLIAAVVINTDLCIWNRQQNNVMSEHWRCSCSCSFYRSRQTIVFFSSLLSSLR